MSQMKPPSRIEKLRLAMRMAVVLSSNSLYLMSALTIVATLPSMAATFARHGAANSAFEAQLVLIIAGVTAILGAPAISFVAQWTGKKPALLAMFALYAASAAVCVFESSFTMLMIARAVQGFAAGAMAALSVILLGSYYDNALRFRLLGYMNTIQMILAALSMVLCGWLVDRFGWNSAFIIYVAAGLIMFLGGWFSLVEPARVKSEGIVGASKIRWFKEFMPVYMLYAIMIIVAVGLTMTPIQGPFLLAAIGVMQATLQGAIAAVPTLAAMVAGLFVGWLHKRISERWIVILASAVIGGAIVAAGLSRSVPEVAGAYVFLGLAVGVILPVSLGMILERASPGISDMAVGIGFSTVGIAQFLNPIVCAPLTSSFGVRAAFVAIGTVIMTTAIALIIGGFAKYNPQTTKAKSISRSVRAS